MSAKQIVETLSRLREQRREAEHVDGSIESAVFAAKYEAERKVRADYAERKIAARAALETAENVAYFQNLAALASGDVLVNCDIAGGKYGANGTVWVEWTLSSYGNSWRVERELVIGVCEKASKRRWTEFGRGDIALFEVKNGKVSKRPEYHLCKGADGLSVPVCVAPKGTDYNELRERQKQESEKASD